MQKDNTSKCKWNAVSEKVAVITIRKLMYLIYYIIIKLSTDIFRPYANVFSESLRPGGLNRV